MPETKGSWAALGQRIRQERERRGWTQRDLAEAVEMSDRYISNLERGQRQPSPKAIQAIAGALQVKPGDLFSGVPATYSALLSDAAQLANLLREMSVEDRQRAIELVRSFARSGRAAKGKRTR